MWDMRWPYLALVVVVSFLLFMAMCGCEDSDADVHVQNTCVMSTILEEHYNNEAVTYVIECKNKHKHVVVDECKEEAKDK